MIKLNYIYFGLNLREFNFSCKFGAMSQRQRRNDEYEDPNDQELYERKTSHKYFNGKG